MSLVTIITFSITDATQPHRGKSLRWKLPPPKTKLLTDQNEEEKNSGKFSNAFKSYLPQILIILFYHLNYPNQYIKWQKHLFIYFVGFKWDYVL